MHRPFLAFCVILIGGCGTQAPAESAADASAESGPVGEGAAEFAEALKDLVLPDGDADVLGDRLAADMDIGSSLGEEAEAILALLADAERAAHEQLPEPELATASSGAITMAAYVEPARHDGGGTAIPSPPGPPPPTILIEVLMPQALDAVGRPGGFTQSWGPDSFTATNSGGGMTATATMSMSGRATVSGSVFTLEITHATQSTVVVDATGEVVLTKSETHTATGRMDVCPDPSGASIGKLTQSISVNATTNAGSQGRVGSQSTGSISSSSSFRGMVDDGAHLGSVSQDYEHDQEWVRTASAPDGPEARHEGKFEATLSGIDAGPASEGGAIPVGNYSGASIKGRGTGDVTSAHFQSTGMNASLDYGVMGDSFVAAERLWRNSRCVKLAVEEYGVESEIEVSNQGGVHHTEEVDRGSETEFEAAIKHRFGQSVSAELQAELRGAEELTPETVQAPAGTLTYTAPDEDGKSATVRMISTSRQGIGILGIAFETGGKKLKVSIDATVHTTTYGGIEFDGTLSVASVLLTRQDDGTWEGSGESRLTGTQTMNGQGLPCPPVTETGTMTLRATRAEGGDDEDEAPWIVTWVSSDVRTEASCMGMGGSAAGMDGMTGGAMVVLGDIELAAEGETKEISSTKAHIGLNYNVDATVTGEVVTGEGD